jgi:hypothetical protein
VKQIVERDFIPAVKHNGRPFYRHQIEVIANAREARKITGTDEL